MPRVDLVGYSMGCHLVVRLAQGFEQRPALARITLIAPDPKSRRVARDLEESRAGEVSAFDEAAELWGTGAAPGPTFIRCVRGLADHVPVIVVYSHADLVAEWSGNVELLVAELGDAALEPGRRPTLVEAVPGELTRHRDVTVDLRSSPSAAAVHDRLGAATRLRPAV